MLSLPISVLAAQLNVQVQSPAAEPVADVVVYLEKTDGTATPASASAPRTIRIFQRDKRFAPYVSVIQRNETIEFVNSDDITHHVYSATGPARFSFRLRAGESKTVQEFAQTGVIAMGCNIHDWMSGYVLVIDSPLFAFSGKDGWARFADVPAGDYQVQVWHPQLREKMPPVRLETMASDRELKFQLTKTLAEVPRQKALDDFDFLEGY